MTFTNCYADLTRADAYDSLEFANTYYLAYRDLPELFEKHVGTHAASNPQGSGSAMVGGQPRALDFGCGTGRSTRFLKRHGFDAVGIDISPDMLARARQNDSEGDYRLVSDGDLSALASSEASFDLVVSMFTFDNIPGEKKVPLFTQLRRMLKPDGRLISVVSDPQIYYYEWASFSNKGFAETNRLAKSGERVKIIVTDHHDQRPVEDIVWTHESYCDVYKNSGLMIVEMTKPLATGDEPYQWVNETRLNPWVVYVLKPA
jgi:ubiquinone/menaquinone biosynthesis C-methylase UbiE